jgi:hypothetical protein
MCRLYDLIGDEEYDAQRQIVSIQSEASLLGMSSTTSSLSDEDDGLTSSYPKPKINIESECIKFNNDGYSISCLAINTTGNKSLDVGTNRTNVPQGQLYTFDQVFRPESTQQEGK